MRKILLVLTVAIFLSVTASAQVTLGFVNITNNDPTDAAIGEAQLFADLTNPGGNQALFTIRNTGPEASVVRSIYFQDTFDLLSFNSLGASSAGVNFSVLTPPPPLNLPGGNEVGFQEDYGFRANPPAPQNGIGPNQFQSILFDINTGDFATIENAFVNDDIWIGLHVIAFDGGGSESFVSYIPAPGALVLGLLGTSILGIIRKRE